MEYWYSLWNSSNQRCYLGNTFFLSGQCRIYNIMVLIRGRVDFVWIKARSVLRWGWWNPGTSFPEISHAWKPLRPCLMGLWARWYPLPGELEPEDFQKFLPAKTILWFYYLLLCTDHSLAYWYFSSPVVAQESVTPVLQAQLHIRICTSLVDASVLNTFCGLIRQRSSLCNSDLAGRTCVLKLMCFP